jgi:flagellar hook-length control protein FliK
VVAPAAAVTGAAPPAAPRVLRAALAAQEASGSQHPAASPSADGTAPAEPGADGAGMPVPAAGRAAPLGIAMASATDPQLALPSAAPFATHGQAQPAGPAPEGAAATPRTAAHDAEAALRQLVGPITTLASGGPVATSRSVTIALHPGELGRVELRVEKHADGRLAIALAAERPETLALLRSDQGALDRALTQAGLPPDGRSISFDLSAGSHSDPGPQQHHDSAESRGGREGRGPPGPNAPAGEALAAPAMPPPARQPGSPGRLDISI